MSKSESVAYHLTLLQKEKIIQSDFVKTMPIMANRFITITIVTIVLRIHTIMLVTNY